MLYAYVTGKTTQDVIVNAFARGANAQIMRIEKYLENGLPHNTTGIILAGILRGNGQLLNECIQKGITYYYIDHAYFKSGYQSPNWMRITKNGFAQNNIVSADASRYNRFFQRPIWEYNFQDKKNILVLPPSPAVSKTFDAGDWTAKTIHHIRNFTNRKIIVREKSGPVLDATGTKTIVWQKHNYNSTLDELWPKVYCVVTYNSSVALEALFRGIPVICSDKCPAWPISNKPENIENLEKFSRTQLFSSLAWGQYNMNEMISGEALRNIENFRQVI